MISTAGLFFLAAGCKRPPDAPAQLDDLCGYLFEHFDDEDPEALEVGMSNLQAWLVESETNEDGETLTNLERTAEGYVVTNLSQDAVDVLDDRERDLSGLVGAAAGYEHTASMGKLADATILGDPLEVYPGTYDDYVRTYESEQDCFFDQSCDQLQVHNYTEAKYAMGLTVTTNNTGQYRWVDSEQGCGYLQRTWLDEAATVNFDWLGVPEQYFMVVTMPLGKRNVRILSTWIVAELGDGSLPEDLALNLVIDSLVNAEGQLDTYISEGNATNLDVSDCPSSGFFH